MGGPIVRTGTTPKFWKNWDSVFGDNKKTTKKKTAAKATKQSGKKKVAKSSKKKTGKK